MADMYPGEDAAEVEGFLVRFGLISPAQVGRDDLPSTFLHEPQSRFANLFSRRPYLQSFVMVLRTCYVLYNVDDP